MHGTYKHVNNTEVAAKIVYSIPKSNGLELKVDWLNIVNETKAPEYIGRQKIFIKTEDLPNWHPYKHPTS